MNFICPNCDASLVLACDVKSCKACGRVFVGALGVLDFVTSPDHAEERHFYDQTYAKARMGAQQKHSIESVLPEWHLPDAPENKIVLNKIGDLKDKTLLLLGNGESVKELAFLLMNPARLVYSDLSTYALRNISDRYELFEYHDRLTFAAIDAHTIPFPDETFDVVYGFAMVHHLPNLDKFFDSVMRVLKPGGKAIFMDDAFSPIWHYSKQTWLKPLMKVSHAKTGISPEDYQFSMTGGFKENVLSEKIRKTGGKPWFIRTSLLTYLFYRGSEKLFPTKLNRVLRSKTIAAIVGTLDKWVCLLPLFKKNQIRLVWGFVKPT